MELDVRSVTVVGVGLIGGSLSAALSRRGVKVHGVSSEETIRKALDMGIIQLGYEYGRLPDALEESEVVFVCTPLMDIVKRLPLIFDAARRGTIITDAGSTKAFICAKAREEIQRGVYFVGGHPMAGSESRGVDHANPYIFYDAVWVLSPLQSTPNRAIRKLSSLISSIGAKVMVLPPEIHDRIAASVSHLPQLVAVSLINHLAEKNDDLFRNLAAGGFRDMTRIASSSYGMWRDIIKTNRSEIRQALLDFQKILDDLALHLEDDLLLGEAFDRSKRERETIPRYSKGFLTPLKDIRVSVQDRPGELARITGIISYHAINIKDIEIVTIREGEGGILRLGFTLKNEAQQAVEVLKGIGYDVTLVE
jgi:prephenate dehydrogenase